MPGIEVNCVERVCEYHLNILRLDRSRDPSASSGQALAWSEAFPAEASRTGKGHFISEREERKAKAQ